MYPQSAIRAPIFAQRDRVRVGYEKFSCCAASYCKRVASSLTGAANIVDGGSTTVADSSRNRCVKEQIKQHVQQFNQHRQLEKRACGDLAKSWAQEEAIELRDHYLEYLLARRVLLCGKRMRLSG